MTGEDGRDVAARLRHDVVEHGARGLHRRQGGLAALRRTLVVLGDDDVGLTVRGVPVLELGGHAVDGSHRLAKGQAGHAVTGHHVGRVGRDGTDDGHLDAVDIEHLVLGQSGRRGAALVDVGAEVGPARARADPARQVVEALVELVVAHRAGLETESVEEVDRGVVLLRGRLERRATDVVARGDERRVRVLGLRRRHGASEVLGEVAVEVVGTQERQRREVAVERVDRRSGERGGGERAGAREGEDAGECGSAHEGARHGWGCPSDSAAPQARGGCPTILREVSALESVCEAIGIESSSDVHSGLAEWLKLQLH